MRSLFLFLFSLVIMSSCKKRAEEPTVLSGDIIKVINLEARKIDKGQTPELLDNWYSENQIIFFGEIHYVQEHQNFLVSQLKKLSEAGYRTIIEETFYSFSWLLDDYVNGRVDTIPEFLRYFDHTIIEGIRKFNQQAPDSLKFQFLAMDLNHWTTSFRACLVEVEKRIGNFNAFDEIKQTIVDGSDYITQLQRLISKLLVSKSYYISILGENWYERILDLLHFEIASSNYRVYRRQELRESVMSDILIKNIEKKPNSKFLINTGGYHAQKNTILGDNFDRIAKRVADRYPKMKSIVFMGVKGETKTGFNSANVKYDLSNSIGKDNIIRSLISFSNQQLVFLPFSNNIFQDKSIKMTFSPTGSEQVILVGKAYDGLILYPQTSVLNSMSIYNYK